MTPVQGSKRNVMASFHDTYDIRRAIFAEHQRKLNEVRKKAASQRQSEALAVPSRVAEMTPSAPKCDSVRTEVRHG